MGLSPVGGLDEVMSSEKKTFLIFLWAWLTFSEPLHAGHANGEESHTEEEIKTSQDGSIPGPTPSPTLGNPTASPDPKSARLAALKDSAKKFSEKLTPLGLDNTEFEDTLKDIDKFYKEENVDPNNEEEKEALKPLTDLYGTSKVQSFYVLKLRQHLVKLTEGLLEVTNSSPLARSIAYMDGTIGKMEAQALSYINGKFNPFYDSIAKGSFKDKPKEFLEEYQKTAAEYNKLVAESKRYAQEMNVKYGIAKPATLFAASLPALPVAVALGPVAGGVVSAVNGIGTTAIISGGTESSNKEIAADVTSASVSNLVGWGAFSAMGPAMKYLMQRGVLGQTTAMTAAAAASGGAANDTSANAYNLMKGQRPLTVEENLLAVGIGAALGGITGAAISRVANSPASGTKGATSNGGTLPSDSRSSPHSAAPMDRPVYKFGAERGAGVSLQGPKTKVHENLTGLIEDPPNASLTIVDLGGANYTGQAGVGDNIIASLNSRGYNVKYVINDLEPETTKKAAEMLRKRWGNKVEVIELAGDYGSSRVGEKVSNLKPDMVFLMNPGKEAIDGLGGTGNVARVMREMADRSRYGLYFRTAFHEGSPGISPEFQKFFPVSYFEKHFPKETVRSLGQGDAYIGAGNATIGIARDYFIPSLPGSLRPPQAGKNLEVLKGRVPGIKGFWEFGTTESVGGNAGNNSFAVNMAVSAKTGRILAIENPQNWSPRVRAREADGTAVEATVRVTFDQKFNLSGMELVGEKTLKPTMSQEGWTVLKETFREFWELQRKGAK